MAKAKLESIQGLRLSARALQEILSGGNANKVYRNVDARTLASYDRKISDMLLRLTELTFPGE